MSASKERQKRQNEPGRSYSNGKKEGRATKIVTIVVVAAIALGIIAMAIWNTGILHRNATAVTIGETEYSTGVVQFYYRSAYNQFLNTYGQYAEMFGLDVSKPLDHQMYDEEKTWAEFFRETALNNMQQAIILSTEARKANFELTEENKAYIEETKQSIKKYCADQNITKSTYFSYYGDSVTEKLYFEQVENSLLAEKYADHLTEQMDCTDDEITAYYTENKNDFDVVDYRYFLISGKPEEKKDENGEAVEATEEETKAAMETAKQQADAMAKRLKNGEDFTALTQEYAKEVDKKTYAEASASTATEMSKSSMSDASYVDWLFEAGRTKGDITVSESSEGYYIVQYEGRKRHEYATMNIRQILIKPETMEGVDKVTDAQKSAAKEKADEILKEWQNGAATEDSFAELAKKYSQDEATKEQGGLRQKLYKSASDNLEGWVFEAQRKAGDATVVESTEGYSVVYIVGQDKIYWKLQVENAIKAKQYNEWYEKQKEAYPITKDDHGMSFVK